MALFRYRTFRPRRSRPVPPADLLSASISSLRGNCTLLAMKEVTDLPDREILAAAVLHGYIAHHGLQEHQWVAAFKHLGSSLEKVDTRVDRGNGSRSFTTLNQFTRDRGTGTFIVRFSGHLAVVRDGILIDPNFRGGHHTRRVVSAYHIANPVPKLTRAHGKYVRVLKTGAQARRKPVSDTLSRYDSMAAYVHSRSPVTPAEIIANTRYWASDLADDIRRGNIEMYG